MGDSWDFDTQRGEICPMAMHVAFLYIDILRYGGSIPGQNPGEATFSCPDADTLNILKSKSWGESHLPISRRWPSGSDGRRGFARGWDATPTTPRRTGKPARPS